MRTMQLCPSCQAQNEPTAHFCASCGASLRDNASGPTVPSQSAKRKVLKVPTMLSLAVVLLGIVGIFVWRLSSSPVALNPRLQMPTNDVWAAGFATNSQGAISESYLLRSSDGGTKWTPVIPASPVGLVDVGFATPTKGYAWGTSDVGATLNKGGLWETSDGGRTWSVWPVTVTSGSQPTDISDVEFATSSNGWMGAEVGTGTAAVYTTQDGGLTWSEVRQLPKQTAPYLDAVNASTAWMATSPSSQSSSGLLMETTNSGRTWRTALSRPGTIFNWVRFATPQNGWATSASWSGNSGAIWTTDDGGKSWQAHPLSSAVWNVDPLASNAVWAVSGRVAYNSRSSRVTGSDGAVLFSNNGGHSWRKLWRNSNMALWSVSFATPSVGWVAGIDRQGDGVILATTDGGATWKVKMRNPNYRISFVY